MASKAPKHDFAPAWLKIPEQESLKPGGAKSSEHADKSGRPGSRGRDDYYYRYGTGGPPGGPPDFYANGPLPRQRSFDNYHEDRRGYAPPGKYRHHSVEDEYYNATPYGYGYYNNGYFPGGGGGGGEKYGGSHYRSQPSLYRDGGKYPPPNSRGYQMNGGYPPYYDNYMYDYYQGDPGYYNGYGNGGGRSGGYKRPYGERGGGGGGDKDGGRHNGMRNGEKEARGQDPEAGKEGSLEEEFPSLNGESESPDGKAGKTQNNGVWDGRPKIGPGRNSSNHMYRILMPNKQGGQGKKTSVKGSTDSNSTTGNSKSSSTPSDPFMPSFKKDSKEGSPTPPIDILNTRLVTQPKTISDKKSDFLKALRRNNADENPDDLNEKDCDMFLEDKESGTESYSNGAKHEDEEEDVGRSMDTLSNGVEELEIGSSSPRENVLSSSLEAEQRLLREMGWTEADDGECELTEDEKREMEELSRQLKLRKEQCNGAKKILPKTWSPQHMSSFHPASSLSHLNQHHLAPMVCDDDDTDSDLDL